VPSPAESGCAALGVRGKRDIRADELQLRQPGEKPSCSTGQIKAAVDGCAEAGGFVEGTLDRRKHETVALLPFCRQEA